MQLWYVWLPWYKQGVVPCQENVYAGYAHALWQLAEWWDAGWISHEVHEQLL